MRAYKNIHITALNVVNVEQFKEDFMKLERVCFQKDIRETWKEKKHLIENAVAVFVAYDLETNTIVGETYLIDRPDYLYAEEMCKLDRQDRCVLAFENKDDEHLYGVLKKCQAEHSAYGYSLAVLPKYRDMEMTKRLVMMNTVEARRLGYKKVYSHAREGAALHLQEFYEAKVIEKRENWYGTGHNNYLIERDVQALHINPMQPYKQETTYDCGVATSEALMEYESTRTPGVKFLTRKEINKISDVENGRGIETPEMKKVLEAAHMEVHDVLTVKELYDTIDAGHIAIIGTLLPGTWEGHWMIVHGYGKKNVYCQDVNEGILGRMSKDELRRVWWGNIHPRRTGFTAYKRDATTA